MMDLLLKPKLKLQEGSEARLGLHRTEHSRSAENLVSLVCRACGRWNCHMGSQRMQAQSMEAVRALGRSRAWYSTRDLQMA